MGQKEVDKIINKVNGNMTIEGMPLTNNDISAITKCLNGEISFNDVVKELVCFYSES